MTELCQLDTHWKVAAFFAYMLLERWLGSTDKTRAGSTVDLIAQAIVAGLSRLFRRK